VDFTFRKPDSKEMPAVSNLVCASFNRLVSADWSPTACETFREGVSAENLVRAFDAAFFGEICVLGEEIAGVVLFPTARLVALSFVATERARLGIASALMAHGIREVRHRQPDVSVVCLNATRNAFPFYMSQGFSPISPEFQHNGTVATRMALWLPYYELLHGSGRSANLSLNPDASPAALTRRPLGAG
jgi:GNAT superfamily N-acetyltransferase